MKAILRKDGTVEVFEELYSQIRTNNKPIEIPQEFLFSLFSIRDIDISEATLRSLFLMLEKYPALKHMDLTFYDCTTLGYLPQEEDRGILKIYKDIQYFSYKCKFVTHDSKEVDFHHYRIDDIIDTKISIEEGAQPTLLEILVTVMDGVRFTKAFCPIMRFIEENPRALKMPSSHSMDQKA